MPYIYMLHFHRRICPTHPCQHYVGATNCLSDRIEEHLHGRSGVDLIRVAHEREIPFTVVRCWIGGWNLERHLKSLKSAPKFCPVCNPSNPWELYHPCSIRKARELRPLTLKERLLDNLWTPSSASPMPATGILSPVAIPSLTTV